jgi:uncharacterized OsmC-like protein
VERSDATVGVLFAPRIVRREETVKITLLSDDAIRLEPTPGGMTIEAMSESQSYSPFHMLASGLAYCTFSVLASWASHAGLEVDDLTIEVRWSFVDNPHRVGSMDMQFNWPSLPQKRLEAARRVAQLCAIHATLQHPPAINIQGRTRALSLVGSSSGSAADGAKRSKAAGA